VSKIRENTKNSTNSGHSFLAKLLHWSFVFLFAYGIYKQIDNINELEDIYLLKSEMLFALVFLLFLIFRFFYMTKTQKTSLPVDAPKSQRLVSKIVHVSMYICLAGIAGSGMMIGYLFWLGFNAGPLIELAIQIHESLVSLTYWLVSIHVIAAIFHRLRGDGVWNSMVPFWKESD